MTQEEKDKLIAAGKKYLVDIHEIHIAGYAGILGIIGTIVDRRMYPEAIPVAKNSLFGIPEPKSISHIIKMYQGLKNHVGIIGDVIRCPYPETPVLVKQGEPDGSTNRIKEFEFVYAEDLYGDKRWIFNKEI